VTVLALVQSATMSVVVTMSTMVGWTSASMSVIVAVGDGVVVDRVGVGYV
jgi:hypothetical protein